MKTRNRSIALLTIFLAISIGNFFRISSGAGNLRTVDFLSIFVMGALFGLLVGIIVMPGQKE